MSSTNTVIIIIAEFYAHISRLCAPHDPPEFRNTVFSPSLMRRLVFSRSFGAHNTRSTFNRLLQWSRLSPILFDVYANIIQNRPLRLGIGQVSYGYQRLICSRRYSYIPFNESLDLPIEHLMLLEIIKHSRYGIF